MLMDEFFRSYYTVYYNFMRTQRLDSYWYLFFGTVIKMFLVQGTLGTGTAEVVLSYSIIMCNVLSSIFGWYVRGVAMFLTIGRMFCMGVLVVLVAVPLVFFFFLALF